jgi:hypothetical protein
MDARPQQSHGDRVFMFTPGGACAPFQPGVSETPAHVVSTAALGGATWGSAPLGGGGGGGAGARAALPVESTLLPPLPPLQLWGDAEMALTEDASAAADLDAPYEPSDVVAASWREPEACCTVARAQPAAGPPRTLVIVLRRTAVTSFRRWFEFSVVLQRGSASNTHTYGFRRADVCGDAPEDVHAVAERVCARSRLLHNAAQQCVRIVDSAEDNVRVALYDVGKTQLAVFTRRAPLTVVPPLHAWAVESELVWHEHVGKPAVFGVRVSGFTRACLELLPVETRFWCLAKRKSAAAPAAPAAPAPPLVLYHGTSTAAFARICADGALLPSNRDAMLGPGVYFARWDKACRFATRDGATDGVVLRCVVFTGAVAVVGADHLCTCGCAQSGVDHKGEFAATHDTAFVPDNASSVRAAEWCVHRPRDRVWVDGAVVVRP